MTATTAATVVVNVIEEKNTLSYLVLHNCVSIILSLHIAYTVENIMAQYNIILYYYVCMRSARRFSLHTAILPLRPFIKFYNIRLDIINFIIRTIRLLYLSARHIVDRRTY